MPRIYYLDPLLAGGEDGWAAWMDYVAELGFDHVLVPPSCAPAGDADRFATADFDRLHPALGWARQGLAGLARTAQSRGLALLLDAVLDRVATENPVVAQGLFHQPDRSERLDPRHDIGSSAIAQARLSNDADVAGLAHWWSSRFEQWRNAGIAGVRLLGLDRVNDPTMASGLIAGLRRAAIPNFQLMAWTPGTTQDLRTALRGHGLDYVFSSLPWWDWQSDWLWDELTALRAIAPVIAAPEAPFAPRLAAASHDPAQRGRAQARALGFSALLADGWMLPCGFETGNQRPLNPRDGEPRSPDDMRARGTLDLRDEVVTLNQIRAQRAPQAGGDDTRHLGGMASTLAVLRASGPDLRFASQASLLLVNTDLKNRRRIDTGLLLSGSIGNFAAFTPVFPRAEQDVRPGADLVLAPGEVRFYTAEASGPRGQIAPLDPRQAAAAARAPRIGIESVSPAVDGGHFPVKATRGEVITVEADVICDGHDKLGVALLWRGPGETEWSQARMHPLGNDRWQASFPLLHMGHYEYTVEAWRDAFATFRDELAKKWEAGVPIALETIEGVHLVHEAASRLAAVRAIATALDAADADGQRTILLAAETARMMADADDRPFGVRVEPVLGIEAERTAARFASWYEVFPRSLSDDPERHGTFRDVIRHLPRVRAMGFDVLYFPPIHPIGQKNRKGRNNSLQAGPNDPGSPYAIGSDAGGHDALHPELGSFEDFQALRHEAAAHGLELALDFAVQCSPDHPWLKQHPDWFAHRPDGSIRYAENPPKKYEDIVNVDFYAGGAVPDLWVALCDTVLFWANQGVRLFRVDNPHTKPLPFWQWLISEVRTRYPDAIFLAEAFTRPKVMYRLAKIGFSQSYTYFTWREGKRELQDYLTELTTTAPRDFFRPHFFVNTPDINPTFLHHSGRPGFLIRAALAATLSGLWGVYNGFELCEGTPVKPGKEEYLDSEKYEIRAWDWDRPGNIVAEITQLNAIRRANPALQTHLGVQFSQSGNEAVIVFEKSTPDRSNVVMVAISLDPHHAQQTEFEVPLWRWNLPDYSSTIAENLIDGGSAPWAGKIQNIALTPERPYAIWRVRPAD